MCLVNSWLLLDCRNIHQVALASTQDGIFVVAHYMLYRCIEDGTLSKWPIWNTFIKPFLYFFLLYKVFLWKYRVRQSNWIFLQKWPASPNISKRLVYQILGIFFTLQIVSLLGMLIRRYLLFLFLLFQKTLPLKKKSSSAHPVHSETWKNAR